MTVERGLAVEFRARVHREENGSYWAEVLELPGCFASGESLDELSEALDEAIRLYREDDAETARPAVPSSVQELVLA